MRNRPPMIPYTVKIPSATKAALGEAAAENGLTLPDFTRAVLALAATKKLQLALILTNAHANDHAIT